MVEAGPAHAVGRPPASEEVLGPRLLLESVWQWLSEAEPERLLVLESGKKTKINLNVQKHTWD